MKEESAAGNHPPGSAFARLLQQVQFARKRPKCPADAEKSNARLRQGRRMGWPGLAGVHSGCALPQTHTPDRY